jgi:dienelactone hydrolase
VRRARPFLTLSCGLVLLLACSGASSAQPQWLTLAAPEGHQLRLAVFRPRGDAPPRGVVLVLHGDDGFRQLYVDLARRLADRGFTAAAGCWFSGRARSVNYMDPPLDCPDAGAPSEQQLWAGSVDALIGAADGLRAQAGVAGTSHIGMVGNSAGGLQALSAAAQPDPRVGAIVAIAVPYSSSTPRPRVPLLMLEGSDVGAVKASAAVAQNAAQDYLGEVQAEGVTAQLHVYEQAEYGFLSLRPDLFDDAVARSADFLERSL